MSNQHADKPARRSRRFRTGIGGYPSSERTPDELRFPPLGPPPGSPAMRKHTA